MHAERGEKTLVVMAFGDSLTVGYQSPTGGEEFPEATPYTGFLKSMIAKLLEGKPQARLRVELLNRGNTGELTDDMIERFGHDVVAAQPNAVIILGGSNDLGWGHAPSSVARNLVSMYRDALSHEIRPVSCTIPSVLGFDEGIPPRLMLNQLIKSYSAALGVACVDIFSATSDSEGRLRAEYSNDGLHLSALGYEAMADAIFSEAVSGMISDDLRQTAG